ncbi:MAG: hypothetical protein ACE5JN_12475 [Candidatus Methylomirabilia bacterium]
MKLRAFALILTLTLGLLAAPLPVEAQEAGTVYRIGHLAADSRGYRGGAQIWLEALRDLGWVEGQSVAVEQRALPIDLRCAHWRKGHALTS